MRQRQGKTANTYTHIYEHKVLLSCKGASLNFPGPKHTLKDNICNSLCPFGAPRVFFFLLLCQWPLNWQSICLGLCGTTFSFKCQRQP